MSNILSRENPGKIPASSEVHYTLRSPISDLEDLGVSQNLDYHFGNPYKKNFNILGSLLGFPILGN